MNFDRGFIGEQGIAGPEARDGGSRFAEVRSALLANSYYLTWGAPGEPSLPVYEVSLFRHVLRGLLPGGEPWHFPRASRRVIASHADLRWGPDGRGFRRILHPNGVCLFGTWEIDEAAGGTNYTGYFAPGRRALLIARYSACCTETRAGRYRSLSMVGKLYPTTDPDHLGPLRTANFITQEDLGGARHRHINEAEFRNAPDTTPWRRGSALPVLLVTGLVFRGVDRQTTIRQLYPIAELSKPEGEPTRAPEFMRLRVDPAQPRLGADGLDFRDEVLSQIYDRGSREPRRTLSFTIDVSDEGTTRGRVVRRRDIRNWKRIGLMRFTEAVASYNGDFVVHFHHPPWRDDRNRATGAGPPGAPGEPTRTV